ncbi:MAG: adenylate/guanylate cyclase domain-containing protein [Sneathiella sp.]
MADILASKSAEKVRVFQDDTNASNKFLDEALRANKQEGLLLAAKARFIALSIIAVFVIYLNSTISVIYYEILVFGFMVNGWAQLKVGRVGKSKAELFLMFIDLALMTIVLVVPNPFDDQVWSVAMQYKYGNFPYFYVLLASATLAYSWRTIFAMATWTSVLWMIAYLWAVNQPNTLPTITANVRAAVGDIPEIIEFLDPGSIVLHARVQEILVFAIVAAVLALNGWRSKRLLVNLAEAARGRANLSRHFAPNIVDHLAGRDQPLGEVRSQTVVVMFVDIVGFTKLAERESPEVVVSLLRQFHSRMETAVFDHNGTLDKFLGDGLMATFGTPYASPNDARNAMHCAFSMQQSISDWNNDREQEGLAPIKLSIGLHVGEVVLGDIGSERRLEYAVLGDVVNVSSRLEAISRDLGAVIVVSDDVFKAVGDKAMLSKKGLVFRGPQKLRGREEPVPVWTFNRDA